MAMSSQSRPRQLTTPRAAAVAGVIFALLFGAVIILICTNLPEGTANSSEWLNNHSSGITTARTLMPFAGISFLWFIGVLRDGVGRYEDKFFASVFICSGVLFLAMMFVSAPPPAVLTATNGALADLSAHGEPTIRFGKAVMRAATQTYAVRMG